MDMTEVSVTEQVARVLGSDVQAELNDAGIRDEVLLEARVSRIDDVEEFERKAGVFFGKGWSFNTPGVLFWHFPKRNGRPTDVVPQYRPDLVDAERAKYEFPRGSGMVQNVLPSQWKRLEGGAETVVLAEATKQYLALVSWLPEGFAAGGYAGADAWSAPRSAAEKAAHKARELCDVFYEMVSPLSAPSVKKVVIIPDADFTSNKNVRRATEQFAEAVKRANPNVEVLVGLVPGEGKEGIDDVLGRTPEAEREALVASIVSNAVSPHNGTPRAAYGALVPSVVWTEGFIAESAMSVTEDERGEKVESFYWKPLTDWAARVVNVKRVQNAYASKHAQPSVSLRYDIEVRYSADGYIHTLRDLTWEQVADPNVYLRMVPGRSGYVTSPKQGVEKAVAMAVRATATGLKESALYSHTGWVEYEGQWGFLHADGILTASGNLYDTYAVGPDAVMLDEEPATDDEVVEWLKSTLVAWNPSAQFIPFAIRGFDALVASGFKARGGILFTGEPGCGKTSTRDVEAATWGGLAGAQMEQLSSEDTSGVAYESHAGYRDTHMLFDDGVRLRADERKLKSASDTMDSLFRSTYANSGTAGKRRRLGGNTGDGYHRVDVDTSQPLFKGFAEFAPQTGGSSTMDRVVHFKLRKNGTQNEEQVMGISQDTEAGRRYLVLCHKVQVRFLRHVAARRNEGVVEFNESVERLVEAAKGRLVELSGASGRRQLNVYARALGGFYLFGTFLDTILKDGVPSKLLKTVEDGLTKTFMEQADDAVVDSGNGADGDSIVAEVRSLMASGKVYVQGVQGNWSASSAPVVATVAKRPVDGVRYVNFNLEALTKAMEWQRGTSALVNALAEKGYIRGGKSMSVVVNGQNIRGVQIPLEVLGAEAVAEEAF